MSITFEQPIANRNQQLGGELPEGVEIPIGEQEQAQAYALGYLSVHGLQDYMDTIGKEGALEIYHYGVSGLNIPDDRLIELLINEPAR